LVAETRPTWSPIFSAVRAVQNSLGQKAAAKLAAITKSDMRSAQRFLAEDRVPNGAAVFAIVRHPDSGPAFIVQATSDLTPEEHQRFWRRMATAVGDALREKDNAF
jgi:hypothetical protein